MKRTIIVQPGIGDNIWLLMKLVNTGEQFHFHLPDGQPQRGKQIFDLVPSVAISSRYVPGLYSKKITRANIQRVRNYWKKVLDKEFFLSMNEHLEHGRRIENFFPDLQTSFTLPLVTSDQDKEQAKNYIKDLRLKHIGIYGSSYSTTRAWKFWQEEKWFELIKEINREHEGVAFVLIGAEWDLDLNAKLVELIEEHNKTQHDYIAYSNSVGQPLGTVVEILKGLHTFIGFPSGLSILNEVIPARSTVMFYPEHLRLLMNAWADPARIEDGSYLPLPFLEPDAAYQAMQYLIAEEKNIPATETVKVDNSQPGDANKEIISPAKETRLQPPPAAEKQKPVLNKNTNRK